MALQVKHTFVSPKADGPDSTFVRPSNWNDTHKLTMSGNTLVGRSFGPDGDATEIAPGSEFSLVGGQLHLSNQVVFPGTGALIAPSGTTAQRPSPPVNGMIRYNSSNNTMETYENGAWRKSTDAPSTFNMTDINVSGAAVFTGTGAITLPGGTTAQRPAVPQEGMIRKNTDVPCVEYYINGSWQQLANTVKVGKRQTVLTGPQGAQPTMFPATMAGLALTTQNVTSANPMVVTAAGGEGLAGDIDFVGLSETDITWPSAVGAKTIVSATVSDSTCTITTSTAHGLATGANVSVAGMTPAGFNGTYPINVLSATTFSYVPVSPPGSNATTIGTYRVYNFFGFNIDVLGTLTPMVTAQPPVYIRGVIPDTTLGRYNFDYAKYKMYLGDGTTANPVITVFIGEGQAGIADINGLVCYAYRGRLRGTVPIVGSYTQWNHNIGVTQIRPQIWAQNSNDGNMYSFAHSAQPINWAITANIGISSRLTAWTSQTDGSMIYAGFGGLGVLSGAQWQYLFDLERAW